VVEISATRSAPSAGLQSVWTQVLCPPQAIDGELEMQWLDAALDGCATAALWTGQPALVAPLSYRRHASLDAACAASGVRGWPVRLRRSGGGVVPQGPGILNVTLAYPCTRAAGDMAELVYAHLCQLLVDALAKLGVSAFASAVEGSFCDRRFNLAVNHAGSPRKIAGTAQYWRRGKGTQAVLAHALLIVSADPAGLSAQANQFEADLDSGRHYKAEALASVAQCWAAAHPGITLPGETDQTFFDSVRQHLADALIS